LTSIMANAEMLSMQIGDVGGESARMKLKAVVDASVKLSNMAKDMLDFSSVGSGKVGGNLRQCDFAVLMKAAIEPFETSDKTVLINGVYLHDAFLERREITADSEKLQRIVYNLLSNALKYADKEVSVDYEFTSGALNLTVANDGRPLTEEEAGRVFDPFYQTEDGIKSGGAGLGLSIVKEFVEAHSGRVWIKSAQEGGVAFCLSMPV